MKKFLITGISKFAVAFFALMISQSACFAQNVGGANASVPAQPATTGSQRRPHPCLRKC